MSDDIDHALAVMKGDSSSSHKYCHYIGCDYHVNLRSRILDNYAEHTVQNVRVASEDCRFIF